LFFFIVGGDGDDALGDIIGDTATAAAAVVVDGVKGAISVFCGVVRTNEMEDAFVGVG
jgi:hypothetical protein